MADYLIQDTTLDAIADAINAKTGGSSAMTPAQMVTAIESISGGGGFSWAHQRYTLAEDWSTSATGNTQTFYNTYLTGTTDKLVVVLISNNSVTGVNKAASVIGINSSTYGANSKTLSFYRTTGTNAISATYDFLMSAGSVIDIYITDVPNGG